MRTTEYALWNLCRSLSHKTGVLYFDGELFATHFENTGKNKIYNAAKGLVKNGWFKPLVERSRTKMGTWVAS
jgi:hypothetical protein